MDYIPNHEALSLNQESNAHACLYEYKENTDFIAFIDYDDILLTTHINYFDNFKALSTKMPTAGVFLINRLPAISKIGILIFFKRCRGR